MNPFLQQRVALQKAFAYRFGTSLTVLSAAPGRINLIGEHTDYNKGLVLPATIDREALCGLRQNNTLQLRLYALDLAESVEIDLRSLVPQPQQWANYLLGVIVELQHRGFPLGGLDCVLSCTVPQGAGLSSSAAISCSFVTGLAELFGLELSAWDRVFIAQAAENKFVGAPTGMLDQFASIFGRDQAAIFLDCRDRSLSYHPISFAQHSFVVLQTEVKHNHLTSGYGERRATCERVVERLQEAGWQGASLRDLTTSELAAHRALLDDVEFRRAAFVIAENQRVEKCVAALALGDAAGFGESLFAGHAGLRDGYEVSCAESDFIVAFAEDDSRCLGARQMGGGFGGCVLALVEDAAQEAFVATCSAAYSERFGFAPTWLRLGLGPGARILDTI